MRVFIGYELDSSVCRECSKAIGNIKNLGIKANWTKSGNFHITMFFLGEVSEKNSKNLVIDFFKKELCTETDVELEKIDLYFRDGRPGPIFIGCKRSEKILDIYYSVKKFLSLYGFSFSGKFFPHITLGRVKSSPGNTIELLKKIKITNMRFDSGKLQIYRSELTPNGPIYTKLF